MIEFDLLFFEKNGGKINSDYFIDMGLESLKQILNDKEYNVFLETVCTPLTNAELIKERQKILKDFLDSPELIDCLQSICATAQNNKFIVRDLVYSKVTPKRKLIENLQVTSKSLDVPNELLATMRNKKFTSKTLLALYEQLNSTDIIREIKSRINEISNWVMKDCVSFDIQYGSGLKLKTSHIASAGSYSVKPKTGFIKRKKAQLAANEFAYNLDYILELQVGDLIERGIQNICSILSNINSYIISLTKKMFRQLLFYSAAIKIVNFGRQLGCSVIFPAFESKKIEAKSLYDIGLLVNSGSLKGMISNDLFGEEGFYLISGVNQGGKTTFLKSIGVAQLFAQNGLPVFAEEYDCPVYKNLVSHFPESEDMSFCYGRLAEELTRFHSLLPLIKDSALVLLNESFATTTEEEGYEIAFDVLRALSKVRPTLFFVTHNFRLLKSMNEISKKLENNMQIHSLIVDPGKSSTDRTYTIISGAPQEAVNGLEYITQSVGANHLNTYLFENKNQKTSHKNKECNCQ